MLAERAKMRARDRRAAIPATGNRYALGLRILGSYDAHGSGLVRARPRGKKSAIGKERNASAQRETLNAYRPRPTSHAVNELPHPQLPVEFGLLKVNPEPITEFT